MQLINLCWLCHQPLALAHHGICCFCYKRLPELPHCCPRCGLATHNNKIECLDCSSHPPAWHSLIAVTAYQAPLKKLVSQLKFNRHFQLAPVLARLLLLKWLQARRNYQLVKPDLLLTVPLHKKRRWQRGFNQTELIAQPLAHWIGCHYLPQLLSRDKSTHPQQILSAIARKNNLYNIFSCHGDVKDKHIVLVDDIVTTGSTVNEISQLLLAHGAMSIQILCLCRTL